MASTDPENNNNNEEKVNKVIGFNLVPKKWAILVLRVAALMASASAAIVMGLNKETNTFVVATIGTTPVTATLTAKFQHTPAFVFFVIANGLTAIHNLLMIGADLFGEKLDYKGLRLGAIAILDMLNVALVSGGVGAATFMAELGKNGNSHANWNKICDKFNTYCDHGGGAIAAAYAAVLLMLIIAAMSIVKLLKPVVPYNTTTINAVP